MSRKPCWIPLTLLQVTQSNGVGGRLLRVRAHSFLTVLPTKYTNCDMCQLSFLNMCDPPHLTGAACKLVDASNEWGELQGRKRRRALPPRGDVPPRRRGVEEGQVKCV